MKKVRDCFVFFIIETMPNIFLKGRFILAHDFSPKWFQEKNIMVDRLGKNNAAHDMVIRKCRQLKKGGAWKGDVHLAISTVT